MAEDNEFDAECLRAPANRQFRIYLENRDADPHNLSIYSADPAKDEKAEQLYKGKAIKGPGQEEYALDETAARGLLLPGRQGPRHERHAPIRKPKK